VLSTSSVSKVKPKLLLTQNDVIRLIYDQNAVNCCLRLALQQRSVEQQRSSAACVQDVIERSNKAPFPAP